MAKRFTPVGVTPGSFAEDWVNNANTYGNPEAAMTQTGVERGVDSSLTSPYAGLYTQPTGSTVSAPDPYEPGEMPEYMSDDEANTKAGLRVDPTFDSLRSKNEFAYAAEREKIPQYLAARHGMSGTRGGRRQSSEYGVTQRENAAISDLENQRLTAQRDMAEAIQDRDWNRASQIFQMREDARKTKYANSYQAYRDSITDKNRVEDNNRELNYTILQNTRSDAKDEKIWGREDANTAYEREQDANSLENNPEYRALTLEGLRAGNAASWRSANAPYSSGGGGSSSGGGLTPYQLLQYSQEEEKSARDYADRMTDRDSRATGGGWSSYVDENGQTQWAENTPEQIWDAYYQKYLNGE